MNNLERARRNLVDDIAELAMPGQWRDAEQLASRIEALIDAKLSGLRCAVSGEQLRSETEGERQ